MLPRVPNKKCHPLPQPSSFFIYLCFGMYRNSRRFTIETTTQVLICVVQCVFESTVDLFHLSSACVEEVMRLVSSRL